MKKQDIFSIVNELTVFLWANGCRVKPDNLGLEKWTAGNNHTFLIDGDFESKVFAIYHKNENGEKQNFLCWMDEPHILEKAKQFILREVRK